jgi:LAO/AO transport system kinase
VANKLTIEDYVDGVIGGDRAVLGRAITLVESDRPEHRRQAHEMLSRLLPSTGHSQRIGISGVPGVGKSTFIEAFGVGLIESGHRIAVLAVDPSSSLSGGSILGDKTRMGRLAASDHAFIRPSPTGGALGGVARKTRETMLVAEAAGFDVVLVETVGVGQSETVVAGMVDAFLLLSLAGAGDELQGIKRGILELAHIISINKADGDNLPRAERARMELERALELLRPPTEDDPWTPRVVLSSALEGTGLEEIWRLIQEHRSMLESSGLLEQQRRRQRLRWMWSLVDEGLLAAVREHRGVAAIVDRLEGEVIGGTVTPTAAAERILAAFGIDPSGGS